MEIKVKLGGGAPPTGQNIMADNRVIREFHLDHVDENWKNQSDKEDNIF